jgi:hypothetical protein
MASLLDEARNDLDDASANPLMASIDGDQVDFEER